MTASPHFDALEAQVDDGLGQLIAAAERKLAELQHRREALDREIDGYARKVRTWRGVRDSIAGTQLRLVSPTAELPTKREAVLAFLNEHPDTHFKLVEIRRGLIERGFMADDRRSIHALEVAVLGMATRNEIGRPRKGIYTLRPRDEARTDESVGVQT